MIRTRSTAAAQSTVVIFQENSDGEGADLVLSAGGEGRVNGAHDTQGLHDEGQDLGAELGRQLDQSLQDAGEEGLQDMGALRQLQLVTVPEEPRVVGGVVKILGVQIVSSECIKPFLFDRTTNIAVFSFERLNTQTVLWSLASTCCIRSHR